MKKLAGLATLAVGIGIIVYGIMVVETNTNTRLLGFVLVPVGLIVSITGLKVITN